MAATTNRPTPFPTTRLSYTTPPNSQGRPQYSLIHQQHHPPDSQGHPQYSHRQQQHHRPKSPGHPFYTHRQQQHYSLNASPYHSPAPASPASPLQNAPKEDPYSLPLKSSQERQQQQKHTSGFVPAALRVTDRPTRPEILTPPHSVHGSTDSLDKKSNPSSRPKTRRSATEPFYTFSTTFIKTSEALAKIPEADLTPALATVTDLPEITGPPTREHWKPDANAEICDFYICQKKFYLFERRHHCRHCGHVFCAEHSTERLGLDQDAEFHPLGEKVRCCDHCAKEWIEWVEKRVQRIKNGEDLSVPAETRPVPLTGNTEDQAHLFKGGMLVGSVGAAEWSTF